MVSTLRRIIANMTVTQWREPAALFQIDFARASDSVKHPAVMASMQKRGGPLAGDGHVPTRMKILGILVLPQQMEHTISAPSHT